MTHITDFQTGDEARHRCIKCAMYAVAHIAQATRPRSEPWMPLFIVHPTHAAMYKGANDPSKQLTFWKDVAIAERDKLYSDLADAEDWDTLNDLYSIEYNAETGAAEWVPGVGPAPIWSHPTAAHSMSRNDMAKLLDEFIKVHWS